MSAQYWVELSLFHLLGRVLLKGVFRGGCDLNMTFNSLTADVSGGILPLLFDWPEAFQHWSLKVLRLGQVSVAKWQPLREPTPANIP